MAEFQMGVNVFAPMVISSRLMAALTIDGAGTLHLEAHDRTSEGRFAYRLVIEDADGTELFDEAKALESEVGADVDYLGMAQAALSFLTGAAEDEATPIPGPGRDGDEPPYFARVIEWVERHRAQLEEAAERLVRWSDYHAQPDVRAFLPHAREGDAGAIRAIASFADYFMTSELGRLGREAVATLA